MEVRKAAHMAVLKHRFNKEMDWETLKEAVNLCVQEEYFVINNEGFIQVGQRHYILSDDKRFGGLGEEQEHLLAEIIGRQTSRINAEFKEDVKEGAEELRKQSKISLFELLEGKKGKCFAHAPMKMEEDYSGKPYRYREVNLLLEGDGEGRAFILDAIGADMNDALDIRDSKIFINLASLNVPRPPRMETLKSKGFSYDDAKKIRLFWSYLDRSKKEQEAKLQKERQKELATKAEKEKQEAVEKAFQEAETLKEEYAEESTVALDRVLLENPPMEGIFYAEFHKEWRNPDGTKIPKGLLFFQGEQKNVDGKPQMRVRRAPKHLFDEFFTKAHLEFAPYDESFEGLEQPLRGLLKTLSRQVKNQA